MSRETARVTQIPRVAVTLTQFWHTVPGGTATSIERLVSTLDRSDHVEVTGIAPKGNVRHPLSIIDPTSTVRNRMPSDVRFAPLPLPALYEVWTRIGRPSIDALGDFDVVHLTVPVTPPKSSLPLVVTVHDLFPITHPELLRIHGAKLMEKGLRAIMDRADKVVVSTTTVADECIRLGFDGSRLEVIPFGIESVTVTETQQRRVLSKYGLHGPYVLFVGTMEPRKNLRLLIEAMIRMNDPEITLVLAGPAGWDGSGDDATGHVGLPGTSDIPSPVVHLGFVPEEDLPALKRGAVAFCFPSLAEGFGLPVLEAMAAGSVVITSNVSATAEVAGDGAVLVDPHDPDALASAIRLVVEDPIAASELRTAAVKRAAHFDWNVCAESVIDVYRSVMR